MAQSLEVCTIDPDVKKLLEKFRYRKAQNNSAIIMKINKTSMEIVLDEELDDCDLDEVRENLSEHQPRYLVYSFKQQHADGRVSYPMCFVYVSPEGAQPEQQMMYAGSKLSLVNETGMTKVFEVRSVDDLTEEWLISKLKKLY